MTAQETIEKLILYAQIKKRLNDPEGFGARSPLQNMATSRRLRKELIDAGIMPELLDLSGEDIAQTIYETLSKRRYA